MAILKMISTCHPTKVGNNATLKKCINYALNPKKTQNGLFTGASNCSTNSALEDMIRTKQFYGKDSSDKNSRTGYHWTISWSPEEHVDYYTALEIVKEFCEKQLKDYECVYSVHTDQAHTHCHIVFNSVNFNDGKKFRYEDGDWAKIFQPELDKLCKARGLHTLEDDTGMSNKEYYKTQAMHQKSTNKKKNNSDDMANKKNTTEKKNYYSSQPKQRKGKKYYKKRRGNNKYYNEKKESYTKSEFIKKDIDDAILSSHSLSEFFMILEGWGYKLRHGKSEKYGDYFALTGRGMERARRNYALGKGYSLESIKKRIELKNNPLPEYEVPAQIDMRQFIVRYVYWKKPKYDDNSILSKRVCVLMYKRGILNKKGTRPNYYEIKKSLKKIREYENNIDLINEYHIGDVESANAAIVRIDSEISNLDEKRKAVYVDRMPYKELLKTYNEMKKNEMAYYSYENENGMAEYKEQHDRYIELKSVLNKYGFSDAEIEKYQEEIKTELKRISKEKRQLKKKISSINNIKDFIDEKVIDAQEVEQEYENIPEPEEYQLKQEEQKENKKEKTI